MKSKLTQGELRNIVDQLKRDILRWIEGFKECGFKLNAKNS
jgi:hypothetical protein